MDASEEWIEVFLETKGNEYFCEVDPEFIADRFNLTGLNTEVDSMQAAIEVILGPGGQPQSNDKERHLQNDARHLYGLIHARFILTTRGLQKMMAKFHEEDFGRCPRALCRNQPMLPIGLSDVPHEACVKLYCPKCEDVYNPKSSRHAVMDGAYWGSSFPGMFVQVYTKLLPRKTSEQYILKVFGFKIHDHAQVSRYQQKRRQEMEQRLKGV